MTRLADHDLARDRSTHASACAAELRLTARTRRRLAQSGSYATRRLSFGPATPLDGLDVGEGGRIALIRDDERVTALRAEPVDRALHGGLRNGRPPAARRGPPAELRHMPRNTAGDRPNAAPPRTKTNAKLCVRKC